MYVKNVSYTNSLVILKYRGDLYRMRLESASFTNLTLGLEKLERNSYTWDSAGVLQLESGESCVPHPTSTSQPYPSYPKSGVYVTTTGYRTGLASLHYNRGTIIGKKMTGEIFNNI